MSVTVKICGITHPDDAACAVEAGADALGLMFFAGSPRCVTFEQAGAIAKAIPPFVARVGVFVDAEEGFVWEAIRRCGLTILQFHGQETPEFCRQFGLMSIKAFRMRGPETLKELPDYPTDAWLLDSYVPGQAGGTGARFKWDLAVAATKLGKPVFLAGGLTPENVAEAVRQVRPFAVDVSSGVESVPGRKDAAKVRAFVRAAKDALE